MITDSNKDISTFRSFANFLSAALSFGKHAPPKPNQSESKSSYRVVGRYILPREIMNFLSNERPSKNGEIELTSSINKLLLKSPRTIIAQTSESKIFHCGSKEGFLGANIFTAMQDKILKKQINRLISPGGGIGRHKGLKIPR